MIHEMINKVSDSTRRTFTWDEWRLKGQTHSKAYEGKRDRSSDVAPKISKKQANIDVINSIADRRLKKKQREAKEQDVLGDIAVCESPKSSENVRSNNLTLYRVFVDRYDHDEEDLDELRETKRRNR
jgi:hypothetical protein